MSADSNNNNLEDFFRNSLNDFSTEPSSQLWNRIEAGIPAKPARKIRIVYILFATLILLLLTALVYQHLSFNKEMKDMAQKVENQEGQIQDLQQNFEDQINQLSNQLTTLANTKNENPAKPDNYQTATVTQHPNNGAMKTSDVENYGVFDRSDQQLDITASGQNKANHNPSIPVLVQDEQADKRTTIEKEIQTAFLDKKVELLDYLAFKNAYPVVQNDFKLDFINVPKQKKSSASIEAYTAAYHTFPKVNLSPSGNQSNKFDSYSKSAGALLSFGLNRNWDVQFGLGFSKMNINDEVSKELYYDNEESDGNGQTYSSRYSYTVRTNYGDLLISSTLSNERINDGMDIRTGDPFLLNVKFQKEIRYFNLPLFVRYKLGNGRLKYSIKGGVIQKFLFDEQTKLSEVEPDSDRLMNSRSIIEEDLGAIRQSGTDALMGLGLEYQLTKRNKINVESIIVQSLNEIYKDIQPFSIGIQLGLQHRLGK